MTTNSKPCTFSPYLLCTTVAKVFVSRFLLCLVFILHSPLLVFAIQLMGQNNEDMIDKLNKSKCQSKYLANNKQFCTRFPSNIGCLDDICLFTRVTSSNSLRSGKSDAFSRSYELFWRSSSLWFRVCLQDLREKRRKM